MKIKKIAYERISVDELQILLNTLGPEIEVEYPLYNFPLFSAKYDSNGYQLKMLSRKSMFDQAQECFKHYSAEMPSYSDFCSCLISCGVKKFKNIETFINKVNAIRQFLGEGKRLLFGVDTNLMYNRFFSNHYEVKSSDILIVDTVVGEIENKMNMKYTPSEIVDLKNMARYQRSLLDELRNKRKKVSRIASHLALREYLAIRGDAKEIKAAPISKKSSRVNDNIIVKRLRDFQNKNKHTLVMLLTADGSMIDLCKAEGIDYFIFDVPYEYDVESCSAAQFCELLFCLSCIFGFIKINSVIIFGEFKGKSVNKPDELKILFVNENFTQSFKRDLKICRDLLELKIVD